MPPGRSLLPKGVTRDEIEAYVKEHPKEKKAIYDERTVVEIASRNPLRLKTTPYHVKYRQWLVAGGAASPQRRRGQRRQGVRELSPHARRPRCSPTTTTRAIWPGCVSRIRNSI